MGRSSLSAFGAAVSLALFSTSAQAAGEAVGPEAFGSTVLSTGTTPYGVRWASVQSQALASGAAIAAKARQFQGLERLRFVNTAVNGAIRYSDDSTSWGKTDHWATASQTFIRGSGDCEDYAIAKMQVLRAAAVAAQDLFLVVGNDLSARSAHAMLIVRMGGNYWVLDNFHDEVRPDSAYREFRPIISLSSAGRWLHGYRRGSSTPLASKRDSKSERIRSGSSLASVLAAQAGNAGL